MTPRYSHALDNLEKFLRRYKRNMDPSDVEQLEEDLFYLKIFRRYVEIPNKKGMK